MILFICSYTSIKAKLIHILNGIKNKIKSKNTCVVKGFIITALISDKISARERLQFTNA